MTQVSHKIAMVDGLLILHSDQIFYFHLEISEPFMMHFSVTVSNRDS